MIERAQALEKVEGRNTDRRGSRGGKSREPRERFRAETLDVVEVHIPCVRAAIRFVNSLFKLYVDAMAWHIATSIAGSSNSGRATPIRQSHVTHHNSGDTSSNCQVSVYVDKYCDHVGLPDLCVGIRFVDDGELQFLSEFGQCGVLRQRRHATW